ncbi:MAG: hypothetical protein QNJ92_06850 [Alphaproteobacteria bacterium]|nr:hypothetical protein [Alphaproteobacteria bacterium]
MTEQPKQSDEQFQQIVSAIKTEDLAFLRAIEQAAHDLLCWTHQDCIDVEPSEYRRHVSQLHPGVYNKLNSAEQTLYNALMRRPGALDRS